MIKKIGTVEAPAAIGPYSQAVEAGGFVFCSGQIPIDPATGQVVEGDVGVATERVITNLASVLAAAGLGLADVVRTTVFLTDMADFSAMNEVYARVFGDSKPARACVAVTQLPKGVQIEIDAIAARPV